MRTIERIARELPFGVKWGYMRNRALKIAVLLVTAGALLGVQGKSEGKGKSKDKEDSFAGRSQAGGQVNMTLRFGSDERRLIREYFSPRLSQLPPGLQKKVARGGTLPPGWQKKVQAFPADLDRRLPPLPTGYRRVQSGPAVWLVNDAANLVVDILELVK